MKINCPVCKEWVRVIGRYVIERHNFSLQGWNVYGTSRTEICKEFVADCPMSSASLTDVTSALGSERAVTK